LKTAKKKIQRKENEQRMTITIFEKPTIRQVKMTIFQNIIRAISNKASVGQEYCNFPGLDFIPANFTCLTDNLWLTLT
jgi:hypothetical protein